VGTLNNKFTSLLEVGTLRIENPADLVSGDCSLLFLLPKWFLVVSWRRSNALGRQKGLASSIKATDSFVRVEPS
jgi:hypothetical protein